MGIFVLMSEVGRCALGQQLMLTYLPWVWNAVSFSWSLLLRKAP